MYRGTTTSAVLLGLVVLGLAGAILWYIVSVASSGDVKARDARAMRQIYVGLSIYEGSHDEHPAPDLLRVREEVGDDGQFLAVRDPNRSGPFFPLDPALPESGRSPIRISYSYLLNWQSLGRVKLPAWPSVRTDPNQGLLSSFWYGTIDGSGLPHGGGIVRVNTDGSIRYVSERRHPDTFNPDDLFRAHD